MAAWFTDLITVGQDLMSSVAEHFDLDNPASIIGVASVFILLFAAAKMWAYSSR
jgi:hypothetical protein